MGVFSDFVDTVSGIAGTIGSYFNQKKQNQIAEETLEYNKQLNQTIQDREDTAIQRAVADARASGLSPLTATGGATSSGSQVSSAQLSNAGNESLQELANRSTNKHIAKMQNELGEKQLGNNIKKTELEEIKINHEMAMAQKQYEMDYTKNMSEISYTKHKIETELKQLEQTDRKLTNEEQQRKDELKKNKKDLELKEKQLKQEAKAKAQAQKETNRHNREAEEEQRYADSKDNYSYSVGPVKISGVRRNWGKTISNVYKKWSKK